MDVYSTMLILFGSQQYAIPEASQRTGRADFSAYEWEFGRCVVDPATLLPSFSLSLGDHPPAGTLGRRMVNNIHRTSLLCHRVLRNFSS